MKPSAIPTNLSASSSEMEPIAKSKEPSGNSITAQSGKPSSTQAFSPRRGSVSKTANHTRDHQQLVDDLLHAFGSRPDVRIWTRSVGFDMMRKIKYGIKGETDLQGIVAPSGRMLCIEVKTGAGRLTKEQERWRDMVIKFGAIYIEARSVEAALTEFEKLK